MYASYGSPSYSPPSSFLLEPLTPHGSPKRPIYYAPSTPAMHTVDLPPVSCKRAAWALPSPPPTPQRSLPRSPYPSSPSSSSSRSTLDMHPLLAEPPVRPGWDLRLPPPRETNITDAAFPYPLPKSEIGIDAPGLLPAPLRITLRTPTPRVADVIAALHSALNTPSRRDSGVPPVHRLNSYTVFRGLSYDPRTHSFILRLSSHHR